MMQQRPKMNRVVSMRRRENARKRRVPKYLVEEDWKGDGEREGKGNRI